MQDDPRAEEQPVAEQAAGLRGSPWMHLCRHPSCVWAAAIEHCTVLIRTGAAVKTCSIELRRATSVEPQQATGRRARAFRQIMTTVFTRLAARFVVICLLLALAVPMHSRAATSKADTGKTSDQPDAKADNKSDEVADKSGKRTDPQ